MAGNPPSRPQSRSAATTGSGLSAGPFVSSGIDRRYQVFISSTYRDLGEERQEIVQALLELDCIPAGMELFPASDDEKWQLISKVIADCDYYLVVIAGRYGSTDAKGISYTESEYDLAVSLGKPVMAFIHAAPEEIAVGKSDTDPEAARKLKAFREKAERKMCKMWQTPEELGAVVSRSLVKLIKSHPGVGWVRGDQVVTPQFQAEMGELRAKVAELEARHPASRVDPETLARGSEEFEFRYDYSYRHKDGNSRTLKGKASYTWDAWFRFLAPSMVNEAAESVLKASIRDAVENVALQRIKGEGRTFGSTLSDVDDGATQIIIQFLALRLIQRSEKRRPINDPNTYWTLTPEGHDYMLELRAIRRNQGEADEEVTPSES